MAKLVKLSAPLDTGEEWALVGTYEDMCILRTLMGQTSGPIGIEMHIVLKDQFSTGEYELSFDRGVIDLIKVK